MVELLDQKIMQHLAAGDRGRHPHREGKPGQQQNAADHAGDREIAPQRADQRTFGNAGGHVLNTTVMPFILRGVSILGISSANCPDALRREIWQRLGSELKPQHLELIHSQTVQLEDLMPVFKAMIGRETQGRTVVKIKS